MFWLLLRKVTEGEEGGINARGVLKTFLYPRRLPGPALSVNPRLCALFCTTVTVTPATVTPASVTRCSANVRVSGRLEWSLLPAGMCTRAVQGGLVYPGVVYPGVQGGVQEWCTTLPRVLLPTLPVPCPEYSSFLGKERECQESSLSEKGRNRAESPLSDILDIPGPIPRLLAAWPVFSREDKSRESAQKWSKVT